MSAIRHLLLNPQATLHASDRSWERDIPWETVKHVANNGISSPSKDRPDRMVTEARDPNNIDHHIKVVTDNPPTRFVTVIRDTSRPFKDTLLARQTAEAREHEAKAKKATSKARQKEQLEKKRARTPKPKNK